MSAIEKLFEFIPKSNFVKDLRENKIGQIKLAFVRETTNPLIIRSNDSESTITMVTIDGRELVEIPPRKLKSREKLLGLKICRKFELLGKLDGAGMRINGESVRYNSIEGAEYLNNPNSVLFGDSSTKAGDTAALVSRAIYDWAYSLRDVKDITDKLQHNALSESGTMIDEKTGEMRQSLFSTEYILPNTFFPHFITVDNISPELFFHLLSSIINQYRYGAQTTTNANNMVNHLVAIGIAPFEKPITSYTVSKQWFSQNSSKEVTLDTVVNFVKTEMESYYKKENLINNIEKLIAWINELWDGNHESALIEIYEQAAKDSDAYLKSIKMIKGEDKKAHLKSKKARKATEESQKQTEEVDDEDVPDFD
jgi:CRISPR-associated protein Csc2